MSEYLSGRKRNLNIGISSYTENKLVLDVIGNTNITGITSLASAGGITTTGGDLYVGGTIYLKDITLTPETIETNYLNVSVASTLGIASASSLIVSGITTIGEVTISPLGFVTSTNPGITTVTYYGDGSKLFGVKTFGVAIQELTSDPVYITFANNIGVSSIGISSEQLVFIPSTGSVGIGTTAPKAKLDVSGNANISGVVTATTFYGNLIGTATTATDVIGGIGSLSLLNVSGITTLGITSTTNLNTQTLNVSGITTVGFLTASNISVSGIVTAPTFIGNLIGTATTAINVIGGIGSLSSLVVSGIITATSFVGSGTSLTDVRIGIQSGGSNIGFAGTVNFTGAGVSSVTVSAGIATINIPGIIKTKNYYIANEGQTIFACSYIIGDVEVYLNGIKLSSPSYIAIDGSTVVLNEGASLNDEVEIIGYISQPYLNIPKFLTVGVRSNNPITFPVSTNQFTVLNRSGGNTSVYITI